MPYLADGLIAYYKLDESSGDRAEEYRHHFFNITSLDLSDGGVGHATGKINEGASFPGGSAGDPYFLSGNIGLGFSSDFSISFWFKKPSGTTNTWIFSFGGDTAPTDPDVQIYFSGSTIYFNLGGSIASYGSISNNTWYHVVATCNNAGDMTLFINGVSQATASRGTLNEVSTDLCVGKITPISDSTYVLGAFTLDELSFWDRVLSSGAITGLYNSGSPPSFAALYDPKPGAVADSGDQVGQTTYDILWTPDDTENFLSIDIGLLSAGATVTSVTVGGYPAIFLGAKNSVTSFGRLESWYYNDAPIYTFSYPVTITVTLSSAINSVTLITGYHGSGLTRTTRPQDYASNQATNVGATDATVVVSSVYNRSTIHAAVVTTDGSITSGQTSENNVVATGGSVANEYLSGASPTSNTMSYTGVGALMTWIAAGYELSSQYNYGPIEGSTGLVFDNTATLIALLGPISGQADLAFSTGTCSLRGAGSLSGSGAIAFATGTCSLKGVGALAGTSADTIVGSGTAFGVGALVGSAALSFSTGTCSLKGAGVLAGSTAVTFGSSTTLSGSVSAVGTSALSLAGSGTIVGAGSLLGTSTFVTVGSGTLSGAGALASSSALLFSGSGTLVGAGDLVGSATLSFSTGTCTLLGAAPVSGQSDLAFGTGTCFLQGLVSIVGSSSLNFAETSPLIGTGALVGSPAIAFGASGDLINPINLISGSASLVFDASVTVTGSTVLEGSSSLSLSSSTTLTATGILSGSVAITTSGSAQIEGTGALGGSVSVSLGGRLDGPDALDGAADISFGATGTILASGALSGISNDVFAGSFQLTGSGTLFGSSSAAFSSSPTITGAGSLAASSPLVFGSSPTITGVGALFGSSSIVFSTSSTLLGTGQLIGNTLLNVFVGTSSLTGQGALLGSASVIFSSSAVLKGVGIVVCTSPIVFSISGTLSGVGALAGSSGIATTSSGSVFGTGHLVGSSTFIVTETGTVLGAGRLLGSSDIIFVADSFAHVLVPISGLGVTLISASLDTTRKYIEVESFQYVSGAHVQEITDQAAKGLSDSPLLATEKREYI